MHRRNWFECLGRKKRKIDLFPKRKQGKRCTEIRKQNKRQLFLGSFKCFDQNRGQIVSLVHVQLDAKISIYNIGERECEEELENNQTSGIMMMMTGELLINYWVSQCSWNKAHLSNPAIGSICYLSHMLLMMRSDDDVHSRETPSYLHTHTHHTHSHKTNLVLFSCPWAFLNFICFVLLFFFPLLGYIRDEHVTVLLSHPHYGNPETKSRRKSIFESAIITKKNRTDFDDSTFSRPRTSRQGKKNERSFNLNTATLVIWSDTHKEGTILAWCMAIGFRLCPARHNKKKDKVRAVYRPIMQTSLPEAGHLGIQQ